MDADRASASPAQTLATRDQRNESVRQRVEAVVGKPLRQEGSDYVLPDGRRVVISYSKLHDNGASWLGFPKRLRGDNIWVLLFGDKHLVFPRAETLLRYELSYNRSGDGRAIPPIRLQDGKIELRIASEGLVVPLDDRIDAYREILQDPYQPRAGKSSVGDDSLKAGEHSQTAAWTDAEIQSVVASYFTMFRAELTGQPYVKADFNREVRTATGRPRGSVEYKFANISAVLRDFGLPYVLGYQPRSNYQTALRSEVERFVDHDVEIQHILEEIPAPDLPQGVELVEVDPPAMTPPSTTGGHAQPTVGVDFLARHARNRDIGLKGELLVVEYERAWLLEQGRPDLAKLVDHVPSTRGDGAGYDVHSFLLDGSAHHIEVKTTCGSITVPFFVSRTELCYALHSPGMYSIYRIFDLGPKPKLYKLTGDMTEILELRPESYQAWVKAPDARSTARD